MKDRQTVKKYMVSGAKHNVYNNLHVEVRKKDAKELYKKTMNTSTAQERKTKVVWWIRRKIQMQEELFISKNFKENAISDLYTK